MIFYERPVSAGLLCQRSDMEKTLESQYIYKGKIINVRKDKVLLPDGKTTSREVVEHRGGVCVVPVDENGNVTLVRQYRYPIGREVLEIPAGKREEGEDPFETARRELSEETGLEAGKYDFLGEFLATPGYCAEKFYIYLARDLTRHAQHLDEGEFLDVVSMPLKQAAELVWSKQIDDCKSVAGLLLAAKKIDETKEKDA